jgi:preprotein translocase subunit SecE
MATTQIQTVNTGADKAKLAAASVMVVVALAGFYLLDKQGSLVQWAALLVGLGLAVAVFFTSETGKELVAFGRDAWREVKKVVWPARKEAIQITAYVFGFVLARLAALNSGVEGSKIDELAAASLALSAPVLTV